MKSPFREMREKLGITQAKFRLALGCSQGTLSNLENGLVDHFTMKMRRSLRSLHIDIRETERLQREFAKEKTMEIRAAIAADLKEK